MFNIAKGTDRGFREGQVLGGVALRDADTYRTMSCGKCAKAVLMFDFEIGPDPADPSRVIIKRVNQIGDGKWAYEEVTLSKADGTETEPTVHSTMHKVAMWDLYRKFDAREEALLRNFKPRPCVTSFSLFYTKTGEKWNPLLWLPSWALGLQGG